MGLSSLSSTFKSLDLPPKEYEQQLQQYEFEVRNHIKVEQQLKLHIEVLQDKIEEMEKERDTFKKEHEKELRELENKIKTEMLIGMQVKDRRIEELTLEVGAIQAKMAAHIKAIEKKS